MRKELRTCALVCAFASVPAATWPRAQERHQHPVGTDAPALGAVSFTNSGNAAAQAPFLRGLALLHNFEYDEAAEALRTAQQADPSLAMAFWAEALTYSHLLWGQDDPAAARRALGRLAASPAARLTKAATPRERAYGTAIEALYAEGGLSERVRGFAGEMRRVAAAYPDDLESAAFASLALLFASNVGQLPPDQRQSARDDALTFAQRVFAANPQHPGGAHYLIHATDVDPALAPRGLEAARRYAEIAPDAQHALHMPSHIFVQLGLWDDAVASNERAWAASETEVATRKLSNADLSFHALEWLQYGYLQAGRYEASRGTIDTARRVLTGVDTAGALHVDSRYAVRRLEFLHASNTGQWSGSVCRQGDEARPRAPLASERERVFEAVAIYQGAVAALMCEPDTVSVDTLQRRLAQLPEGDFAPPIRDAAILQAQLLAYINSNRAPVPAVVLADAPSLPSLLLTGPTLLLRTEELLGARLKAGRPREAIAAYEQALRLTPNRSQALLGLARARRAAGDHAGAADAYRRLLENWRKADPSVPALREAREHASGI